MLSDDQLDVLSGALVPLYQFLEKTVIADVARRIRDTLKMTRTAELRARALYEIGYSPSRIRAEAMKLLRADKEFQRVVDENTSEYKRDIAERLRALKKAVRPACDEAIRDAGEMAWENDDSLWKSAGKSLKKDNALHQIVDSIKVQTKEELTNLTNTTGFRTSSGLESVREVYRKELDKALVKLASGAYSQEECLWDAVKELAQSGLRSIDYDSGRSYQLDTAVRMCIQTAAGQLAANISDANIRKTGVTLVQVSAHRGARDKGEGIRNHKEWQGKIYSIDGKLHPEEEKRIEMEIRDLLECTGYNVHTSESTVDGLHGINCRHDHYPFFEGFSTPNTYAPEPEPKEINGKLYTYYDMTQGMRRREREVRALKRERDALKELGEDAKDIKAKIRQKTKEYQHFCDKCGLKQKPERMRVDSGTFELNKTKAWKEYKQAKENVAKQKVHDRIEEDSKKKVADVHKIGKIDKNIYKCITDDIVTDDVVITDNQIQHIQERHPEAYEKVLNEMGQALEHPDYIIKDKRENTGLVVKKLLVGDEYVQMVLRICTSIDPEGYKNSIISCWEISEKRLANYLRNKEILYKKE